MTLVVADVPEMPEIHLSVNGSEVQCSGKSIDGEYVRLAYEVKLSRGANSVRIWNAGAGLPAVDRLEVGKR